MCSLLKFKQCRHCNKDLRYYIRTTYYVLRKNPEVSYTNNSACKSCQQSNVLVFWSVMVVKFNCKTRNLRQTVCDLYTLVFVRRVRSNLNHNNSVGFSRHFDDETHVCILLELCTKQVVVWIFPVDLWFRWSLWWSRQKSRTLLVEWLTLLCIQQTLMELVKRRKYHLSEDEVFSFEKCHYC